MAKAVKKLNRFLPMWIAWISLAHLQFNTPYSIHPEYSYLYLTVAFLLPNTRSVFIDYTNLSTAYGTDAGGRADRQTDTGHNIYHGSAESRFEIIKRQN